MSYRNPSEKPAASVIYEEIKIDYYESNNEWVFILRGRERTAESLSQAKMVIDKPVAEKKPVFEKQEGFMQDRWGRDEFREVTITSLVEDGHYVWVTDSSKERSKEKAMMVFLKTSENLVHKEKWVQLNRQKNAIQKEQNVLIEKMKTAQSLATETSE